MACWKYFQYDTSHKAYDFRLGKEFPVAQNYVPVPPGNKSEETNSETKLIEKYSKVGRNVEYLLVIKM